MNFLAHLYLSENKPNLTIGNFIADHIQGNHFSHFDPEIQQGILLHRHIDTFTDTHKIVRKSKRRLNARYGHYRGVIIDIFYDHFLAKNWANYSTIPLYSYVESIYQLLESNRAILPKKTLAILPFMIENNWLYNYQFLDGIQQVLTGMSRRIKHESNMQLALEDLQLHYNDFEKDFTIFFEDLRTFSAEMIEQLNN